MDNFKDIGLNRSEVIIQTAHNLMIADAIPPDMDIDSLIISLSSYTDRELAIKLLESHTQREAYYANLQN